MKGPKVKVDTSGTEAAQRAVAQAQQAANNLQTNMQADLKSENIASVVAGGSADEAAMGDDLKRRRNRGSLSSQLGISV